MIIRQEMVYREQALGSFLRERRRHLISDGAIAARYCLVMPRSQARGIIGTQIADA